MIECLRRIKYHFKAIKRIVKSLDSNNWEKYIHHVNELQTELNNLESLINQEKNNGCS